MAVIINGSGTVTGLAVGGLPDGSVDADTLAANSVTAAKIVDGTIVDAEVTSLAASKLTGALPAISGAALTGVNAVNAGRKNLIINGGFDVWQRSTAATSYGNYASADRWKQITAGEVSKVVDGDRNTVLKLVTSTGQAPNRITQYLEAPARLKGKTLTLSFWMKTSEVLTLDINFWVGDAAGNYPVYGKTGGSAGNSTALGGSTSTSWTKYTTSVVIPSYTEYTNGTDKMEINIGVVNGTAAGKSIYYDDIQLEVGSVATDFEHRSYGEELALCLRYFWAQVPLGSATGMAGQSGQHIIGNGYYLTTTQVETAVNFPVQMRAAPTLNISSGSNHFVAESYANNDYFNSLTRFSANKQTALLYASNSDVSGTGGNACRVVATNTNSHIYWEAEL